LRRTNDISSSLPLSKIESAICELCRILEQENKQMPHWTHRSEDDLWRELVACILGSRVRFEVAHEAVDRMHKANLFSAERRCSEYDEYEQDIFSALSGTTNTQSYPYSKLRASQIRATAQKLYDQEGSIRGLLDNARDVRLARRCLASEVSGLGPKQASLFLRNIGYAVDIAVLDVHVLTYMNWIGLTTGLLKSVRTIRQYEMLEDVFIEHSCAAGYPPDSYDVAVWVVVRLAKKEYQTCR
jgi:N-glycosylase/DNA lyase